MFNRSGPRHWWGLFYTSYFQFGKLVKKDQKHVEIRVRAKHYLLKFVQLFICV